jgi:hypothetical protein
VIVTLASGDVIKESFLQEKRRGIANRKIFQGSSLISKIA